MKGWCLRRYIADDITAAGGASGGRLGGGKRRPAAKGRQDEVDAKKNLQIEKFFLPLRLLSVEPCLCQLFGLQQHDGDAFSA